MIRNQPSQQHCDDGKLIAVLSDGDQAAEHQEVVEHIEQCSRCQQRFDELAAGAQDWTKARQALLNDDPCSENWVGSDKWDYSLRNEGPVAWTESMASQLLSPASHPELLGRIGRYDVERLIGSGGMGVVFKAHDSELNRPVAIKILAPYLSGSGPARKRFAREARAAAAVVHEHVVPIYNVETERETPFLVMHYIAGESLQGRIDRDGALGLCEILRIGMQAASGLSAAHQQGLVHRDIKPSNILMEQGVERALITDFGLARAADDASLTRTGFHPGTPQYMSPEQAAGEQVDARSDLFSLGSVLYTMCTGRPPFRAETSLGVLRRITDVEPRPIREINPNIPEWLSLLIARLMSKSPEDRFANALEVADLLGQCLAHVQQPAAMPLPEAVAALAPKRTRRPPIGKFIAAAAGAAALFFAGILIVLELGKGTLTIESELDDVPIRIMQGEEVVKSLTVSKEGATTRIGAGKYIVEIGQDFDKAVIKDGGVELSRGATAIVKVTHTNADTAEDEKAKDEAAKAWLRRPVAGRTLDGKSFQLAGHDALLDCVMRNNSEALNRLLTMDKYDLEFSPRNGQWTLLQTALLHECVETTSLLLQHGANPTFASKGTPLPLELAQRSGRKELVELVQKYLESNAPHSQTKADVQAAELQGTWRLVYQPLDGALESSEVGYSLSIDEQTLTLAGHSHPYKLLPQNAIQWSCPPEHAGIKFASGKYEVIDQDHVRIAVRYHESPIDATAWPKTASSNNPEEGVDYYLLIRAKDAAITVPPMVFDTLEDILKPGRELFDKEMKQIDERLATVVEGSAEHSLLTTKKKQLQQQWDLSVAQVKGMAAAAKAGKPVQLAPIVIPNNSRPWQAPMPDPLSGHDEDIAKVLAGTWQVKRYVAGGEETPLDGSTVTFSKNMLIMHLKLGDEEGDIEQVYRIGNDKIDIWDTDSGPDIRTALPYLVSYSLENDTLRICYHGRAMEFETPQSRPPVQPGKGFIYLELQRAPIAEKVSVAKGETDDLRSGQSYKIKLIVLANDDLKPVAGAMVDVTLIRSDSGVTGDGGFAGFKTDEDGIATIDKSLWPGRYLIQVRAPEGSRYRDTEFTNEESILVVHEDGRYSPREFRLASFASLLRMSSKSNRTA